MYTTITVTAISLKPKKWDKDYNAEKLETYFRKAARDQADLIVAPEGILEGYVAMDVIRNPERGRAMVEIAEPLDGPYVRRFQDLAQELRTCLCFGFAERIGEEVYNTAIFIDQDGDICGHYHKTQLAEGAHASWYFDRVGRRIRAFDTPLGRMGMVICNDRSNPKISRTLVLDGARCLLISVVWHEEKVPECHRHGAGAGERCAGGASKRGQQPDSQQRRGGRVQVGLRPDHDGSGGAAGVPVGGGGARGGTRIHGRAARQYGRALCAHDAARPSGLLERARRPHPIRRGDPLLPSLGTAGGPSHRAH